MPRYYGRRNYRRYSKAQRARQFWKKLPIPQYPAGTVRRLTYDDTKFCSPTTAAGDYPTIMQYYGANDIYDCDASMGGRSAQGLVDAAKQWSHYTVLSSRITIELHTFSGSAQAWNWTLTQGSVIPIWWAIALKADKSAWTTPWRQLMGDSEVTWVENSWHGNTVPMELSKRNRSLTKWFSAKNFFSVTDPRDEDTLGATCSASPADGAFFHILATPVFARPDLATDYGTFAMIVHIDYYVSFQEPVSEGVIP